MNVWSPGDSTLCSISYDWLACIRQGKVYTFEISLQECRISPGLDTMV